MTAPAIGQETRFVGFPISGGVVRASVCLFNEYRHNNLPTYRVSDDGVAREKDRLQHAIGVATAQLADLTKRVSADIGPAEAEVFVAHQTMLTDRVLIKTILDSIETQALNAESAVAQTLHVYESRMLELDNQYMKERSTDIGDIRRRLLDALADMNPTLRCADQAHCQRGRGRIIVAEELTPSLTVELDTEQTMGFVTERGGPTSHAAILAKSLGVPAVSGIKDIYSILNCGTDLLVDGDKGEVIAWPSEDTIRRAKPGRSIVVRTPPTVGPVPGVTVMANISESTEAARAVAQDAEGIGLYRTELEFLAAGRLLTEDEQLQRYASVVATMAGQPVCIRLLDIGGDKGAPFFDLPEEENPQLGLRGSRLLLSRDDLLRPQARAIARASQDGPVDVLYPMVVDCQQFVELKTAFLEATADLPSGQLRHGVMFEVPSACLQARELLQVAEFGSIGTNDLIQYLFAIDRNNTLLAGEAMSDHSILWSLLSQIAIAAQEAGRVVSVCGEVASEPRFLPLLKELGLTTMSVAPRLIPELRLAAMHPKHDFDASRPPETAIAVSS